MRVFNLVTSQTPFFKEQVRILEKLGVECETVAIPNQMPRNITDYISFYPLVINKSFDSYDVVHANYGLTAPFALAQPQRPLVLTLWGSDLRFFLQEDMKGWISRKLACLDYFQEIIVRNKEMKDTINEIFGKEVHVIPSGVDLDKFKPMKKDKAQKHIGWNPEVKHILFPYDPSREVKNYPLAKEVCRGADKMVDFELKLQVVSGIPHEDIPMYINGADVLILTSKAEGSPNAVKEAMACNTPVVSTDVGDVKYLLKEVKNSEVYQNKDQLTDGLIRVLKKGSSSNGRKKIKELGLGLKTIGEKIIKVYRKALKK